jgi:hypothetical protein
MVLCLKSAEALTHMIFNDALSTYDVPRVSHSKSRRKDSTESFSKEGGT